MKLIETKAFTLVELLVVITILAIISVVAYQNFWWAVDKAVSWRKINDISTIETALQQYKVDNNYYPPTDITSITNVRWYSWTTASTPSNTIKVTYSWEEIATIVSADWGWIIYWTWTWAESNPTTKKQIWAKWTISRETLWKTYLSKDLYDPEVWDLKIGWTVKMIDKGLWRYIYATFKKSKWAGATGEWWTSNYNGLAYNLAYTIKEKWSDKYVTKIVWDYDEKSCFEDEDKCLKTLIGLNDGDIENWTSDTANFWVPYAVTDFAQ